MIITDENLLRAECSEVSPEEIAPLRDLLEKELQDSARLGRIGVGLAAPQIGIFKKMAIVRLPASMGNFNIDLVNIKEYKGYDKVLFNNEGCLSFPNYYVDSLRYQEIYVTNNGVEPFSFIATGMAAICCQHEIDHLRGILLTDIGIPTDAAKKAILKARQPRGCLAPNIKV